MYTLVDKMPGSLAVPAKSAGLTHGVVGRRLDEARHGRSSAMGSKSEVRWYVMDR